MTTKFQVIALFKSYPQWSSRMIAEELDCSSEYVRTTLKRNNLKLSNDVVKTNTLGRAALKAGMTISDVENWKKK